MATNRLRGGMKAMNLCMTSLLMVTLTTEAPFAFAFGPVGTPCMRSGPLIQCITNQSCYQARRRPSDGLLPLQSASTASDVRKNPNEFTISTDIILNDIPIEAAYDSFADLSRQPVWSTWLSSVEPLNNEVTVWKMRYLGVSLSWQSVSQEQERPRVIGWRSIQGLRNHGRVTFSQQSPDRVLMTLQLTFELPRVLAAVFSRAAPIKWTVRTRMLDKTLQNFRAVMEEEIVVKKAEMQPEVKKAETQQEVKQQVDV